MRVLAACSLGGAGHLGPLLPVLAAARRRGDDTLVVGPAALGDLVAAAGLAFWPGGEPPGEEVAAIRERLPVAPAAEASVLGNRELFGRLATGALLPAMEQACTDWAPDLVVREPCEYASAVVAGRRGIPTAQVAISLAETEAGAIGVAAPALERHRRRLADELSNAPYLTRFPASLDPSPFPTTIRFRPPAERVTHRLPRWWGRSEAPLVYVSMGTVLGHMAVAGAVYRTVLGALDGLAARVLLTVGHDVDLSSLGRLPATVHVEPWVEQERVFGEAALVVCHGGSGTVVGALAAGVPLVVVPSFADQFENGRRIAGAGAGLLVEPGPAGTGGQRRPVGAGEAAPIRAAVDAVLGGPSFERAAGDVAREMAGAPSVDEVLAGLRGAGPAPRS